LRDARAGEAWAEQLCAVLGCIMLAGFKRIGQGWRFGEDEMAMIRLKMRFENRDHVVFPELRP